MTTRSIPAASTPRKNKSAPAKPTLTPVARKRHRTGGVVPGGDESVLDETPSGGFLESAGVDREDVEGAQDWLAEPIETLPELEREIGMADWIDPQTGEPAEGQSPPHLEEE